MSSGLDEDGYDDDVIEFQQSENPSIVDEVDLILSNIGSVTIESFVEDNAKTVVDRSPNKSLEDSQDSYLEESFEQYSDVFSSCQEIPLRFDDKDQLQRDAEKRGYIGNHEDISRISTGVEILGTQRTEDDIIDEEVDHRLENEFVSDNELRNENSVVNFDNNEVEDVSADHNKESHASLNNAITIDDLVSDPILTSENANINSDIVHVNHNNDYEKSNRESRMGDEVSDDMEEISWKKISTDDTADEVVDDADAVVSHRPTSVMSDVATERFSYQSYYNDPGDDSDLSPQNNEQSNQGDHKPDTDIGTEMIHAMGNDIEVPSSSGNVPDDIFIPIEDDELLLKKSNDALHEETAEMLRPRSAEQTISEFKFSKRFLEKKREIRSILENSRRAAKEKAKKMQQERNAKKSKASSPLKDKSVVHKSPKAERISAWAAKRTAQLKKGQALFFKKPIAKQKDDKEAIRMKLIHDIEAAKKRYVEYCLRNDISATKIELSIREIGLESSVGIPAMHSPLKPPLPHFNKSSPLSLSTKSNQTSSSSSKVPRPPLNHNQHQHAAKRAPWGRFTTSRQIPSYSPVVNNKSRSTRPPKVIDNVTATPSQKSGSQSSDSSPHVSATTEQQAVPESESIKEATKSVESKKQSKIHNPTSNLNNVADDSNLDVGKHRKAAGWPSVRYDKNGELRPDAAVESHSLVTAAPWKLIKPKKEIPSLNFYLAGLPHVSGASSNLTKSPKKVEENSPQSMRTMPEAGNEEITGEYIGDSYYVGGSSFPMTLSPTMAKAKATIAQANAKNKSEHMTNNSADAHELGRNSKHAEKMQELLAILNPETKKKKKIVKEADVSAAEGEQIVVQPKKTLKQPYVSPQELRERKQKEFVEMLARQNLTEQQYNDRLKKKAEQEEKRRYFQENLEAKKNLAKLEKEKERESRLLEDKTRLETVLKAKAAVDSLLKKGDVVDNGNSKASGEILGSGVSKGYRASQSNSYDITSSEDMDSNVDLEADDFSFLNDTPKISEPLSSVMFLGKKSESTAKNKQHSSNTVSNSPDNKKYIQGAAKISKSENPKSDISHYVPGSHAKGDVYGSSSHSNQTNKHEHRKDNGHPKNMTADGMDVLKAIFVDFKSSKLDEFEDELLPSLNNKKTRENKYTYVKNNKNIDNSSNFVDHNDEHHKYSPHDVDADEVLQVQVREVDDKSSTNHTYSITNRPEVYEKYHDTNHKKDSHEEKAIEIDISSPADPAPSNRRPGSHRVRVPEVKSGTSTPHSINMHEFFETAQFQKSSVFHDSFNYEYTDEFEETSP